MSSLTTNRRLMALGLALVLAALATAALLSYVRGVERRTLEGQQTVGVLVAREAIPAGTTAEAASSRGLLAREPVPSRYVPEHAITSLTQLQGKVAAVSIAKGEQIVEGRFVSTAQLTGVLPIPADRQALAVDVDVPAGVGGFVQPGNRISLIAKFELDLPGGQKVTQARYLVQDVAVLAVGTRVLAVPGRSAAGGDGEETESQQTDRVQLTLAVTPADAEKIVLARLEGELWATLLPPGQKPATTQGRNPANVFN